MLLFFAVIKCDPNLPSCRIVQVLVTVSDAIVKKMTSYVSSHRNTLSIILSPTTTAIATKPTNQIYQFLTHLKALKYAI